jgi:tRNA(Ser,Leu) C12 N-acetylase TAN1
MPKEDNIMMLKVYGKLEDAKKLIDEAMSLCNELQPVRITPEHTLDDIRSRIKEMMEQARPQAKEFVKEMLQRHKAAKLSDLRPDQYEQVWKECREWVPF